MYASTYARLLPGSLVVLVALIVCAAPTPADAGALDAANAVRRAGCEQRPGIASPLHRNDALDRVADRWSRGGALQAADDAGNYRARKLIAVKLTANVSDAAIADRLRSSQCRALVDPEMRDAGLVVRGDSAWLVLAAPHSTPATADAKQVAAEVLVLVNEARSTARQCGSDRFPAAPPLSASAMLTTAAQAHAGDLAQNNRLSHEGRDGSQPAERAQRAGYTWRLIGENVAGGPSTAKEVVDGWLSSPAHCRNIMEAQFTEMGVGYATAPESRLVIYWAQMFGRPR